jgi:hypothetical protein
MPGKALIKSVAVWYCNLPLPGVQCDLYMCIHSDVWQSFLEKNNHGKYTVGGGGVNKLVETLINWGIKFLCVGYIEITSVGVTECSSFCLYSVILVSMHWLLRWVTAHVKESENRRLVRFSKRTDRWCAFSWSICDKNCHIYSCIESGSFQGHIGIHESWKDNTANAIFKYNKILSYMLYTCYKLATQILYIFPWYIPPQYYCNNNRDHGFASHSRHGCMSAFFLHMCCLL